MSEYKCSHCGFPISPNDPGIRHYGTHVAHEEHHCNSLLLGRIADLERQLAAMQGKITILEAQLKTAYGYGSDKGTPPWMK